MPYGFLTDFIIAFHLAFIVWVLFGAFLVLKWRRLAWVHVPSVLWGMSTEFFGLWCPLTPLENWLRAQSGRTGYETSFIEYHVMPIVYPAELTRELQMILGATVLVINGLVYGLILRKRAKGHARR